MVELLQVTQLMHDDEVDERQRKKQESIIEIQIAFLGTTAPARTLVADGDAPERKAVVGIPYPQALGDQTPGGFFVLQIMRAPTSRGDGLGTSRTSGKKTGKERMQYGCRSDHNTD